MPWMKPSKNACKKARRKKKRRKKERRKKKSLLNDRGIIPEDNDYDEPKPCCDHCNSYTPFLHTIWCKIYKDTPVTEDTEMCRRCKKPRHILDCYGNDRWGWRANDYYPDTDDDTDDDTGSESD